MFFPFNWLSSDVDHICTAVVTFLIPKHSKFTVKEDPITCVTIYCCNTEDEYFESKILNFRLGHVVRENS